VIVPTVPFPPTTPFTAHVTLAFAGSLTVAVNWKGTPPTDTVAVDGDTETVEVAGSEAWSADGADAAPVTDVDGAAQAAASTRMIVPISRRPASANAVAPVAAWRLQNLISRLS
jgi:hypothetical protein